MEKLLGLKELGREAVRHLRKLPRVAKDHGTLTIKIQDGRPHLVKTEGTELSSNIK